MKPSNSGLQFQSINPVKSAYNIRKAVGILAFALPISLIGLTLYNYQRVQPSLSHYYYTNYREIFTGILMGIGLFMICYTTEHKKDENPGAYKRARNEQVFGKIAGVAAILIALFPTIPVDFTFCENDNNLVTFESVRYCEGKFKRDMNQYTFAGEADTWVNNVHLTSALTLFIILAILSIFYFPSPNGKKNLLYRIYGFIVIIGIAVIVISVKMPELNLKKGVLIGEVIALFAFGASWLCKGREEEANYKRTH